MDRHSIPDRLSSGKLPAEDLDRLLTALPSSDPRLLVGPRLGEDAAVIEMGVRCLVSATDPVTFATDRVGWYAVHVNANDVAWERSQSGSSRWCCYLRHRARSNSPEPLWTTSARRATSSA